MSRWNRIDANLPPIEPADGPIPAPEGLADTPGDRPMSGYYLRRYNPRYEYRDDLIAEDDRGDLWVARRSERRKLDPVFDIPFRRWDPRCWGAWWRSTRLGSVTMVESR